MTEPANLWSNNTVQFMRLLAELRALGVHQFLREAEWQALEASMDLEREKIMELFDRAENSWEAIKDKGYVYIVHMRWGETEPKKERPVTEHTFFSLEECNAFAEAVIEGDGWLSGEQVVECEKHKEHWYPIDEECDLCREEEE